MRSRMRCRIARPPAWSRCAHGARTDGWCWRCLTMVRAHRRSPVSAWACPTPARGWSACTAMRTRLTSRCCRVGAPGCACPCRTYRARAMAEAPLRVLVVDDEPMARARLRRMLGAEHGVHVLGECATGESAAEAISTLKPDVVFLDIQMPRVDGFGALHLASTVWRPRVVFVTAFAEHAVDAFETGAVDYLLKPYSRERLRRALERVRSSLQRDAGDAVRRYLERLPVPVGHRLRMVPVQSIDCGVAQVN